MTACRNRQGRARRLRWTQKRASGAARARNEGDGGLKRARSGTCACDLSANARGVSVRGVRACPCVLDGKEGGACRARPPEEGGHGVCAALNASRSLAPFPSIGSSGKRGASGEA